MTRLPPGRPDGQGQPGSASSNLLLGLRAGEPESWHRVLDLYSPLVYRWCKRWGLKDEDVQDLIQEVFLAASRGLGRFRRDRDGDTFRGWLYGIARNARRDFCRRQARHVPAPGGTTAQLSLAAVPDPVAGEDLPDDDRQRSEDRKLLFRRALELIRGEFEASTWRMFWQVAVEGRSPAEVAADHGVSPAAVRMAKSRVLRRLREELGDLLLD